VNGFAAVAKQFKITYLPETDEYYVRMPGARRGTDRMGTTVPDRVAAATWCAHTWQNNRRRT